MNTTEKLDYHFAEKPIAWVPMWGLSKLRKRGGRFAGAIDGKARYYDQWYERAMSEETAKKLAALGVNLVILPFSLGGSAKVEAEERGDFEKTADYFHKYGIVTLPYLQWQNILQEAGALENAEWALTTGGNTQQYAQWRRTVCQSSKGFLDYIKDNVADALNKGADGIWIDNSYLKPCNCDLCKDNFRKYLAENRRDLLDLLYLKDFERVEIPAGFSDPVLDPIMQAYIEFNGERCENTLKDVKEYMEQISSHALFASNPGIHRGKNQYLQGIDIYELGKLHDIMYLENKLCPGVNDKNKVTGNFHGFLALSELDCAAVAGSWKPVAEFDSTVESSSCGLPETRAEVERLIFEGPTHQNISGMFWAVRGRYHGICEKPEDLMDMYFEKEDINAWVKGALPPLKTMKFPKRVRNLAEIGVYYSKPSLSFSHSKAFPSLFALEEVLLRNQLPYNLLYSEDTAKISEYELLILPETVFMSDSEAAALAKYVTKGGRLMIIGDCGLFDEYGFIRKDYVIKKISGVSYFDRVKEITMKDNGQGRTAFVPVTGYGKDNKSSHDILDHDPAWLRDETDIISVLDDGLLPDGRQMRVDAAGNIGVSLFGGQDNAKSISLMSYEDEANEQDISVSVRKDICDGVGAVWRDSNGLKENFQGKVDNTNYITFNLKKFTRFGELTFG